MTNYFGFIPPPLEILYEIKKGKVTISAVYEDIDFADTLCDILRQAMQTRDKKDE